MKYFHLVWSALMRRKTRTIFTVVSIVAAFLLFGMLDSVRTAFAAAGHSVNGASQLITMSKLGLGSQLPLSLQSRIATVPGVSAVTRVDWFQGIYQDPKNFFPNEAVGSNYFAVQDAVVLPADQLRAFQTTRDGAVVGATLAKRFGWKIGDQIPLEATIWPKKDGSNTWIFKLVGIFHAKHASEKAIEGAMFFRWKYFDEARQFARGTVGWYQEKIASPDQASRISQAIDAISANSDHETKTETANAFGASFISQLANIGLIVSGIMAAVFFTLILLTGNTMAQAVRERIPELAVLKTIGFSNRSVLGLVLAESVLMVVIGGVVGTLLAMVVIGGLKAKLGATFPMANVGGSIWGSAIVLMIAIGVIVGVLPALRGMRLKIVDALAGR
ncbi:MAG: FtsX-like permease family protein [Rhodanobacteraceae bacterium]|nr:MAG: FtsX-like permease family protein [Rhodanobacteraceae bacterium]